MPLAQLRPDSQELGVWRHAFPIAFERLFQFAFDADAREPEIRSLYHVQLLLSVTPAERRHDGAPTRGMHRGERSWLAAPASRNRCARGRNERKDAGKGIFAALSACSTRESPTADIARWRDDGGRSSDLRADDRCDR